MNKALHESIYDLDYYEGRQHKRPLIYRLRRRTEEVERALRRYSHGRLQIIVDVGAADGLMLEKLYQRLGLLTFVGLDMSLPLLEARRIEGVTKVQGNALCLPFRQESADALIATAVIEHVSDALLMLRECRRVLRSGGLLVLTTPDPFMERLSSAIGLLKDAGHQATFNLIELTEMAGTAGFEVLEKRKFMFSPIGFPAERIVERVFGPLGLGRLMANQLLVARGA